MYIIRSISILSLLFLVVISNAACNRGRGTSDEELHRSPAQQGEVPEKTTLKGPHDLYDPEKPEYKSEYIKGSHKPARIIWAASIEQALQMSGEKNKKKIVVYFASQKQCVDCRYVEEKVFTDAQVLKNSSKWIFVRVNVDSQPELAKYHFVDSVPTFKFLDYGGHAYRTQIGKVTPEQFAEMLLTWF